MVDRIKFHVEHLKLIEPVDETQNSLTSQTRVMEMLQNLDNLPNAHGMTLVLDGRILACIGCIEFSPGVAEVWLFASKRIKEHPIVFVRHVKHMVEIYAKTFGWHRIQTVTKVTDVHRKWMKTLGFVEEGTMKYLYKKEDYIMSARYFGV